MYVLRLKTMKAVKLGVGVLPVFDEASGLWMCAAGESCSYGGSKHLINVVVHHRVHSGERCVGVGFPSPKGRAKASTWRDTSGRREGLGRGRRCV